MADILIVGGLIIGLYALMNLIGSLLEAARGGIAFWGVCSVLALGALVYGIVIFPEPFRLSVIPEAVIRVIALRPQ